jgi:hypothetical protein
MDSLCGTFSAVIDLISYTINIAGDINFYYVGFGFSSADFESATILATDSLAALENDQGNGDSVIVLNFRALQAQRIKDLQAELVELSKARLAGGQPEDVRKTLNGSINLMVDRYGIHSIQSLYAFVIANDASA